eukprot:TRINITY_DN1673_c0_g1_i1.p1 TRINITY_DN1673_c0_g1~~TRINITY_DN1673_c0_g1_i1.p1  ORF type:complete len:1317 (-),score=288.13 TRINITY_DN1673_c0_g1_i1:324-4274(-)
MWCCSSTALLVAKLLTPATPPSHVPSHLTDFGSRLTQTSGMALTVLGQKITLQDLLDNLAVVITLLVVYAIFILACIWGRYLDKRDRRAEIRVGVAEDEADGGGAKGATAKKHRAGMEKVDIDRSAIEDRSFIGGVRRWWVGLKNDHRVLSVYYRVDEVFTRPRRLTVLLCILMGHLFINALLYMYVGIDQQKSVGEQIGDKVFFAVMAAICSTPIAVILALLFKRTGRQTYVEDKMLDLPMEEVPVGMRESVQLRRKVREAERGLQQARGAIRATQSLLQSKLRVAVAEAEAAGKPGLTTAEKIALRAEFLAAVKLNQQALLSARAALSLAEERSSAHRKQAHAGLQKELDQMVRDLHGFARIKRRNALKKEQMEALAMSRLTPDEQALIRAQEEELKKLSKGARMLYTTFLNPLKRRVTETQLLWPEWTMYVVYALAAAYCGFCGYYILMFSIFLNKCSECPCGTDTCAAYALTADPLEDWKPDVCVTCPEAMVTAAGDPAQAWLQSLVLTFVIGFVLSEPITILLKRALLPLVANRIVFRTDGGAKSFVGTLKSQQQAALGTAHKTGAVIAPEGEAVKQHSKGIWGVHTHGATIVPRDSDEEKDAAVDDAPVVDAEYARVDAAQLCRLGCGADLSKTSAVLHEEDECLEKEVACSKGCGASVKRKAMVEHLHDHCRERDVACEFCSAVVLAKNLDAHKAATCPQLRLCRCGAHVVRSRFVEHKSTECPYRSVACTLGCGAEMEAITLEVHKQMRCPLRQWTCLCGLTMPVSARAVHERDECPERVVTCVLCKEELAEADRAEHDAELCPMRPWLCECGQRMPFSDRAVHERYDCQDPSRPCLQGCGLVARREARAAHERETCPLRTLICTCGDPIFARDMDSHRINECELRMLGCMDCGQRMVSKDVNKHQSSCAQRLISCPLDCGARIPAATVAEHTATEGACTNRHVACDACGVDGIPMALMADHRASMCKVLVCRACSQLVLRDNMEEHVAGECVMREVPCTLCQEMVPLKKMTAHQMSECTLREVACTQCSKSVVSNDLEQHKLEECPARYVLCGRGCGQRVRASDCAHHESRLCQLITWNCQCGEEVKMVHRTAHLSVCRAYRTCWETVLEQLVQKVGKGELEHLIAKVMQARRCSPAVALCALGESGGSAKHAAQKLKNAAYYSEMKLVCEACDVARFVTAKKRHHRKHRTRPAETKSPLREVQPPRRVMSTELYNETRSQSSQSAAESPRQHLAGVAEMPSSPNSSGSLASSLGGQARSAVRGANFAASALGSTIVTGHSEEHAGAAAAVPVNSTTLESATEEREM